MAKVLANTLHMDRREWLEARTKGIGGSDASVILGLNKWKTPFELWLEKTGQVIPNSSQSEAAYWGIMLEDMVAKEFELRTGKKVRRRNAMFQHPEYPYLIANVDRFVVGEKALLECKTTSAYNGAEWKEDEIPAPYIIQIQHYLGVLGQEYEKAYIAVLIGGQKFIWKEIERDEELIDMIFQAERFFWQEHVEKNIPPEIDGSQSATELLNKLYPTDNGEAIMLDSVTETLIDAIESIKAEKKQLDEQLRAYENRLKMALEDAAEGISNRYKVTYKAITSNRIDSKRLKDELPEIYQKYTKPTISRRLTIKEVI